MKCSFYPGCSMESSAVPYAKSLTAVSNALGLELQEIPDWNCCGATIASGVIGDFAQQVMTARNLALAEKMKQDIAVACSSCFLNLGVTNNRIRNDQDFADKVNQALAVGGLHYSGSLNVRQVIEIMVNDIGFDKIRETVNKPLKGLKVAGYVGCQTVRALPWEFDKPENPQLMDQLIESLGAQAVDFPLKTTCCGSSQSIPSPDIVLTQIKKILDSATQGGAELIVTPCPLCQLNLEAYQEQVNQKFGTQFKIPILFFTQLMGVAFGLPAKSLGFEYMIIPPVNLDQYVVK